MSADKVYQLVLGELLDESVKLSLSAANLFLLTKYSGMDPDVSTNNALFTGFDRMSYPKPRTFTFGANLKF